MTKRDLIDEITEANPGACPGFLSRFDQADLRQYLSKLRLLSQPRIPVKFSRPEEPEPQIDQVQEAPAKRTIEVPVPCPAAKAPQPQVRMGLFRPVEPEAAPQKALERTPEPIEVDRPIRPVAVVAVAADRPGSQDTINDESWLY